MLKKISEDISKYSHFKKLTMTSDQYYKKHAKDDQISCFYDEEENSFYIFVQTRTGLYRFYSKGENFKTSEIQVCFSTIKTFEKTNEINFVKANLKSSNVEYKYFKENFKNIFYNTKELRLKLLLEK